MKLTQQQLEQFEQDGYLFFPSLFSEQEMKVLRDEVPMIYKEFRPEIIREKDGLTCLLYTSPSPRDLSTSRMPSSA